MFYFYVLADTLDPKPGDLWSLVTQARRAYRGSEDEETRGTPGSTERDQRKNYQGCERGPGFGLVGETYHM